MLLRRPGDGRTLDAPPGNRWQRIRADPITGPPWTFSHAPRRQPFQIQTAGRPFPQSKTRQHALASLGRLWYTTQPGEGTMTWRTAGGTSVQRCAALPCARDVAGPSTAAPFTVDDPPDLAGWTGAPTKTALGGNCTSLSAGHGADPPRSASRAPGTVPYRRGEGCGHDCGGAAPAAIRNGSTAVGCGRSPRRCNAPVATTSAGNRLEPALGQSAPRPLPSRCGAPWTGPGLSQPQRDAGSQVWDPSQLGESGSALSPSGYRWTGPGGDFVSGAVEQPYACRRGSPGEVRVRIRAVESGSPAGRNRMSKGNGPVGRGRL